MNQQDLGNDGKGASERHMSSFADTVSRRLLISKWKPSRKLHTLWDEAVTTLGIEQPTNQSLDSFTSSGQPETVISSVLEKLEECKKQKLKFKRKDGTEVIISEQLEKIANYIERFKEVVDEVVQYDPGHAALPWAMVRVLLMVTISTTKTYGSLVDGLECVSRIISRYTQVERTYIRGASKLQDDLAASLVKLYIIALRYLIAADEYFGHGRFGRILKAVKPSGKSSPEELLDGVKAAEDDVLKIFTLVEAEDLRNYIVGGNATDSLKNDPASLGKTKQEQRKMLAGWLQAVFTADSYQNAIRTRLANTNNWIFQRAPYQQWCASGEASQPAAKLLWLHGGPGFGKTVLCSTILESLYTDNSRNLASFFCSSDHEERREPLAILRSWIAQLIQYDDRALRVTFELYKVNMIRPPTAAELWKILRLIASLLPCTLVADGFDECTLSSTVSKYSTTEGRSQFLCSLMEIMRGTGCRVLLVSRDHEDIKSVMDGLSVGTDPVLFEQPITREETEPDVLLCSKHVINTKLADRPDDLRDEMVAEAAEKSAGMFLCLDLLGQEMNTGDTTQSLRKIVSEMPTGLEKAYERELKRILELKGHRREQALAVLRWILFAVRPLSVRELAEALIISSNETEAFYPFEALPKSWKTQYVDEDYVNANIIKYCGSLVELRKSNEDDSLALKTVHFVHASVRDYLLKPQSDEGTLDIGILDKFTENDHLAQLCLRYLCYGVFNDADKFKVRKRIRRFPFLFYATKSWYDHARLRKSLSSVLESDIEKLFSPKKKNWIVWSEIFEGQLVQSAEEDDNISIELVDPQEQVAEPGNTEDMWDDPSFAESDEESVQTENHLEVVQPQSNEPSDSDQSDKNGQDHVPEPPSGPNPIYYASLLGLTNVIKSLRARGLDCNTSGGKFGFPLQAAIEGGHLDTVDYLLQVGTDFKQCGGYYGSALGAAAAHGIKSLVDQLLSMGADPYASDEAGLNTLHHACRTGEVEIAKVLLKHDKSLVATKTKQDVSPLCYAMGSTKPELVLLLRRHGASVNDMDEEHFPVLNAAVYHGYQEVALDLVRHRADIEAVTNLGVTSLQIAAWRGDEKLVRLFLAHHANIHAVNNRQTSTMHFASFGQSTATVKLLLEKGAAVDLPDKDGWKPLHVAAELPNLDIVRCLLDHGADMNDTCLNYSTPIMNAIIVEQYEVVRLLVERGANTSLTALNGDTALDLALAGGNQRIISFLFENGGFHEYGAVEPAPKPKEDHASSTGNTSDLPLTAYKNIVNRTESSFLAHHSALNPSTIPSKTLDAILLVSVALNSPAIVRALLEEGADPSCRTLHRRTPLHIAARQGHDSILEILLDYGASVYSRDTVGSTPLHVAIWQGQPRLAVVEKLLARGALFDGFGDSKPVPPAPDIVQKLTGRWEGTYAHSSWYIGFSAPTAVSMDFEKELPADVWHLPRFRCEDTDSLGPFVMIGYAYGKGTVRCLKMQESFGRYCEVTLEEGTGEQQGELFCKGKWGENDDRWHGTIDLRKIVKEGEGDGAEVESTTT